MARDAEGMYVDLIIPKEVYNPSTDGGKPTPHTIEVSVIREVYAADGAKVQLPLQDAAVMDCIRTGKASSETIRSMDILPPQ